jgi:hypothetical protein
MRTKSTHSQVAASIRKHLKEKYPKHLKSVTSSSFAGGNAVDVNLEDLPPKLYEEIGTFCNQFQYGHFDGMYDSYEYSNNRQDIPQVKYVQLHNDRSLEMTRKLINYANLYYGLNDNPITEENYHSVYIEPLQIRGSELIHRVFTGAMGEFWGAKS